MLADDAVLVREGLARVLTEAGVDVVAQVGDADALLHRIADDRPDAAIVDIRMPPDHAREGLVAAQEIGRRFPEVGVLVLSQYVELDYALELLAGGPGGGVGYLLKERVLAVSEITRALRRIVAGETVIDPSLVALATERARARGPLDELTDREREVLELMAEGLTDRGIAERLVVTPRTVETHVRHILLKLGIPAHGNDNRRVLAVLTLLRA